MIDLKDRVNTGAPIPPVKEKGPGRRRDKIVIMPDIIRCEQAWKTQHENCWTIHYFWMVKWNLESGQVWLATSDSRIYRHWLEVHPECFHDGIPPHISFGGAVVSGEPDPEFYNRWVKYAQKTFC